jgi:hypothetical protein
MEGLKEGGWEFVEVREDGEPSSSSLWTHPISLRIYFFLNFMNPEFICPLPWYSVNCRGCQGNKRRIATIRKTEHQKIPKNPQDKKCYFQTRLCSIVRARPKFPRKISGKSFQCIQWTEDNVVIVLVQSQKLISHFLFYMHLWVDWGDGGFEKEAKRSMSLRL